MAVPIVAIVDGHNSQKVATMFGCRGWAVAGSIETADLVCFTGGADVAPGLYGEKCLGITYPNHIRDAGETAIFKRCRERNIPMVGICRGGQFGNVLSGGRMYQDVDNHVSRFHAIKVIGPIGSDPKSWRTIISASDHHQMMIPGVHGQVIAVANQATHFRTDVGVKEIPEQERQWSDPEVVFYPTTKFLCYQPHPEDGHLPERNYFFELIDKYLGLKTGQMGDNFWRAPKVSDQEPWDDDLSDLGKDPVG